MVDLFIQGGNFMWPILVLLVVGLGFAFERLWTLTRASINTRKFLANERKVPAAPNPSNATEITI